jgi:hypothetical protein
MSSVFCCKIKHKKNKEYYIDVYIKNERIRTWLKAGIWKSEGIKKGSDKKRCPRYLGVQDANT